MSFAYIMVILYLGSCLYLRWQLIWWIKKTEWGSKHSMKPVAVILGIIDMIPIAGAFLPEGPFGAHMQQIGNIWVGLIVASAMCLILAHPLKYIIRPVTAKKARYVLIITLVFALGYNLYGFLHAQQIYTHYYEVAISDDGAELLNESLEHNAPLPAQRKGKVTRIAVLADMHMGVNTLYSTVEKTVNAVNDADVDYVIGAGDYFTSSYVGLFNTGRYSDLLATMKDNCKGSYFAYGNHDVTEPLFCGFAIKDPGEVYRFGDMDRFFGNCGWTMLADKTLDLDGMYFCFRQDASKTGDGENKRLSADRLTAKLDKTKPIIMIQHEPEDFDKLIPCDVDLVISGHTHDGQIWPGNWFTRAVSENAHGFKTPSGVPSIVSSGAGYFGPPLRVGTHSEVVVIDLYRK